MASRGELNGYLPPRDTPVAVPPGQPPWAKPKTATRPRDWETDHATCGYRGARANRRCPAFSTPNRIGSRCHDDGRTEGVTTSPSKLSEAFARQRESRVALRSLQRRQRLMLYHRVAADSPPYPSTSSYNPAASAAGPRRAASANTRTTRTRPCTGTVSTSPNRRRAWALSVA